MPKRIPHVLVVGARCAGATAALALARQGHRVTVIDRMRPGADALSTHFVWARGASYLAELGLLEGVRAFGAFAERVEVRIEDRVIAGRVPKAHLERRFRSLHGRSPVALSGEGFSARRHLLDAYLQGAARDAGAELRLETELRELRFEAGRPVAAQVRGSDGFEEELGFDLLVGADGRVSPTARMLGVPRREVREACTFAAYGYFRHPDLPATPTILKRGRLAAAICPTSEGAHMILAYGPAEMYPEFKRDPGAGFRAVLRHAAGPDEALANAVEEADREGPLRSTDDQAAFVRAAAGPGYALIGDAACSKDQVTAIGMTHAFRDAVLFADCLRDARDAGDPAQVGLDRYGDLRLRDSSSYYDFVCTQAQMQAPSAAELAFYAAVARDPAASDDFLAAFSDTLPLRRVFAPAFRDRLGLAPDVAVALPPGAPDPLGLNTTRFQALEGADLLGRTREYARWIAARRERGVFQYARTSEAFPGPTATIVDDAGRRLRGLNFASQDYLGLNAHPAVREAATRAARDQGPHSSGSPMVFGNTISSRRLEAELGELLAAPGGPAPGVLLFPTGYAAGSGAVAGFVRPGDHVVMDRLAHACLQAGAYAATRKVYRHAHLDAGSLESILREIRRRDARNGILVVTEGTYSMDADSPDLPRFQRLAHAYGARLLVDVAHDLGASGAGGGGEIERQGMLGKIDLVMGSFSKTFAANGGFVACVDRGVIEYLRMYSTAHMFSNAISPVQTESVRAALAIVRSAEGAELRARLLEVVGELRDGFAHRGHAPLGHPSAIVPIPIGDEPRARICHRLAQERGIAALVLEYPVVALGATRFRLQAMATHTREQAREAVDVLSEVIAESRAEAEAHRAGLFAAELGRAPSAHPELVVS